MCSHITRCVVFSCAAHSADIETEKSATIRAMAAAIGIIIAIVGTIFLAMPQLCSVSYLVGGILLGCSTILLSTAACIKIVKQANVSDVQSNHPKPLDPGEGKETLTAQDDIDQEFRKAIDFLNHYQPVPKQLSCLEASSYIATFFKKKLQEETTLSPKVVYGEISDSMLELDLIFPTNGKFECRGCVARRSPHGSDFIFYSCYPAHNFIHLKLPWHTSESFTERVDFLWQQCKNALQFWEKMSKKIESACYEGDQFLISPSPNVTSVEFSLDNVSIEMLHGNISISFVPELAVTLEKFAKITLVGRQLTLTDNCKFLADIFLADLMEIFQKSLKEQLKETDKNLGAGWPNFPYTFHAETTEEVTNISATEIEQLDRLLKCNDELIAAYEQKNKSKGLNFIRPKIIRRKLFALHPDKAGLDKAKQEEMTKQFQNLQHLVAGAKYFFEKKCES